MSFINTYEARLLAEERIKNGLRAAERARLIRGIGNLSETRCGRPGFISHLVDLPLSLLTLLTDDAKSQRVPAIRNTR